MNRERIFAFCRDKFALYVFKLFRKTPKIELVSRNKLINRTVCGDIILKP